MLLQLSQTLFRRRLNRAIALPLVLLLLLSGVSIWQITWLLAAMQWVDHTDRVLSQANYTQKLLLDMETGVRGYLLSNDPIFLEPYQQANTVITANFEKLKNLVSDSPSQSQKVSQLESDYETWNRLIPAAMARRQRGDVPSLADLRSRKQNMDAMRRQISTLIATEEQLRNQRSQAVVRTTQSVILVSLVLAVGVGAILADFIRRQLLSVSRSYEKALDTAQEQTEQAQRFAAALQQYKDIFQFAEHGLVVSTVDHQSLALLNPAFARMHGSSVEELLGAPILDLFPPECRTEAIEIIERVNERGYYACESQHRRKDGTVFPVFLAGTAVRDTQGNLLYRIVSVHDITESKQAKIALQRSVQRLAALHDIDRAILAVEANETLIRNALVQLHQVIPYQQGFVAMFDLETETARILAGSSQTGQLIPPESTQLAIADFAPEQTLLQEIRYVEDLTIAQSYPSVLVELSAQGFRSCACIPLLVEDTLIGELNLAATETAAFDREDQEIAREVADQLAIALQQSRLRQQLQASNEQLQRELMERQHAEVELREQEQLFRSTFNQAAVGIAHVSPSGQWLRVNQKLCEIVGYSREELLQNTFQDITYPDDLDVDFVYVRQMLANEIHTYSMEKRYVRKDNSLIWINLTVSLVREASGQPKYFISVVEDISARKQVEAELQHLNTTLEQRVAERTAQLQETNQELEAFTYSVSHDLRAPLRTMQGFAQALLEDYNDQLDDFGKSYIQSIIEDSMQMDGLISDLLSYSRLTRQQIDLQSTDLNAVVQDALRQLETQIKEKQVQITVAASMPQVLAHRSTLLQAIVNLIGNAIKFVQPNRIPKINLYTEIERHNQQDWVKLWLVDNGIGIAPEHQERIFRIFERLHGAERYPGTGIGLAIVRKGVERMGGQVGVESQLGQGSRFWIALPNAVLHNNGVASDDSRSSCSVD
ncbi:MAG TPA: PAS domain S-box protein [Waterburya sp.]|jgi:PAS domain S-box-containing protein